MSLRSSHALRRARFVPGRSWHCCLSSARLREAVKKQFQVQAKREAKVTDKSLSSALVEPLGSSHKSKPAGRLRCWSTEAQTALMRPWNIIPAAAQAKGRAFHLAEPVTLMMVQVLQKEKRDSLGKRTFWAGSFPKIQERTELLMLPAC